MFFIRHQAYYQYFCLLLCLSLSLPQTAIYAQESNDPIGPEISDDPIGPEILEEEAPKNKNQSKPKDQQTADQKNTAQAPSTPKDKDSSTSKDKDSSTSKDKDRSTPKDKDSSSQIKNKGQDHLNQKELINNHPDTLSAISIFGTLEQRSKTTGSANAVSQEKLEEMEYDDVHQVIHQVPGAYVRDEDGFGLRPNIGLRGASSDRSAKVTLMEDGVLLGPAPYAAPAAYYFPMTTRMTGVEIFKGPSAIEYGPNTIGGAVNMTTRSIPKGKEVGVDIAGGNFQTYKAHAYGGYGGERWGFLVEGLHLRSDGFKYISQYSPKDNRFQKTDLNTGFEKYEAMAKLRWNNDPSALFFHRFELKLGYSTELSNETYLGLTAEDFKSNPYMRYQASAADQMNWSRTQVQLDHRFEIGDRFVLRTVLYRHDMDRTWKRFDHLSSQSDINSILNYPSSAKNKGYYGSISGKINSADLGFEGNSNIPSELIYLANNDRSFVSQGIQSNGTWLLNQSKGFVQKLKFGLRLHQDQVRRKHTELPYQMQEQQLQAVTEKTSFLSANNLASTNALAFHILDELQFSNRLSINPGLRLESYRTSYDNYLGVTEKIKGGDLLLLPGVGSYYQLTPSIGLLGGVHRGFSPVAPGQPKGITPELSTNYELGFRTDIQSIKNQIEAIGFFNDYQNLTAQCTFSNGCTDDKLNVQFNAGKVKIYGLELVVKQQLKLKKLEGELQATYTYTKSSFESNFSSQNPQFGDVKKGDELAYVPNQQLNLLNSWKYGPFALMLVLNYQSDMRDIAGQGPIPENQKIPSRMIFDMAAHYDLFEQHRFYLKVDNLTDEVYIASLRPYGIRPGKPRQIMLGYKWTWK